MNVNKLIPKDKHDIEAVHRLKKYPFDEIKAIIPQLLEWLQDINWPVAKPLVDYLKPYTELISNELLAIIKSDDYMWKYWIIVKFGPLVSNASIQQEILEMAASVPQNDDERELKILCFDIATERKWDLDLS